MPDPIMNLVRELHEAEEGSEDWGKLSEIVRKLASEANVVLFRMAANRIAAQVPPGAFDDMDIDVGDDLEGYETIDLDVGLQGKKNPSQ